MSQAQSEIVESMRTSETANQKRKTRKHQFFNIFNFNQDQNKGESTVLTRNSRAASMVSRLYLWIRLIYVKFMNYSLLNAKSFQHALSDHIAYEPSPDPGKILSNVSSQSSDWSKPFISFDKTLSAGSNNDRRPALINHHRGNYLTDPNMQKSRSTSILTQQTTKPQQMSVASNFAQTRPSIRHNNQ